MENQRWQQDFHKNKYSGLHFPDTIIKVKNTFSITQVKR